MCDLELPQSCCHHAARAWILGDAVNGRIEPHFKLGTRRLFRRVSWCRLRQVFLSLATRRVPADRLAMLPTSRLLLALRNLHPMALPAKWMLTVLSPNRDARCGCGYTAVCRESLWV